MSRGEKVFDHGALQEEMARDHPEWLDRAYDFVEAQAWSADGVYDGSPWWWGWALRVAYLAGVKAVMEEHEGERE